MAQCPKCSFNNSEGANFCSKCRNPLVPAVNPAPNIPGTCLREGTPNTGIPGTAMGPSTGNANSAPAEASPQPALPTPYQSATPNDRQSPPQNIPSTYFGNSPEVSSNVPQQISSPSQGTIIQTPPPSLRHHASGKRFELPSGPRVICLGKQVDPQLGDLNLSDLPGSEGLSRRHAILFLDASGGVEIVDSGSTNGTFQNGTRLSALRPYTLKPGDVLRFGLTSTMELEFE